ncbi:hypothetical protein [Acetobacterium tundrae]|nr:hypothetical protein [Acetobacterium tundrae]
MEKLWMAGTLSKIERYYVKLVTMTHIIVDLKKEERREEYGGKMV